MHRTEQPPRHPGGSASSSAQVESALFSTPALDGEHALFGPIHYESGYAYPLLVWLHGLGGNERQLLHVMPQISLRNFVAVAPRATHEFDVPPREDAKDQGHRATGTKVFGWDHSAAGHNEAQQRVFDSVDAANKKYHIHPKRVFLVGCGDGGTTAFRLALDHPSQFAGVVSIDGEFPRGDAPLRNVQRARSLPLFLLVGRESHRYTDHRLREDLQLLFTAGMAISLRQYPGDGKISPDMLTAIDRWVMEQVIAAPRRSV